MAMILLAQHYLNKTDLVSSFKDFMIHDGIINLSAGVVIGISTYCFIKDSTLTMVLPLIYTMLFGWVPFVFPKYDMSWLDKYSNIHFQLVIFIKDVIVWLVSLIASFLVLEYLVRRTLLKDKDKGATNSTNNTTTTTFEGVNQ